MLKRLVRHGNSLALVIDKPVLDLLKITEDTPLEIETPDGKSLHIRPFEGEDPVDQALVRTRKKFGRTLRNLAK